MRKVTSFAYLLAWVFALAPLSMAYAGDAGTEASFFRRPPARKIQACSMYWYRFSKNRAGNAVKTISVGTGQALALGAKGDADVVLVHAPVWKKICGRGNPA